MNIEVSKHAYEYLDDWDNFNDETSFPEKENFHRYLSMERFY